MGRFRRLRIALQLAVAAAIVALLVETIKPASLARAAEDFPRALIPVALGLTAGVYTLKSVRYHQLLRGEGVCIPFRKTAIMTVAGESMGLLPLGELARGELVSEATGTPVGTTMAGVTIQELLYTAVLAAIALPGALANTFGLASIATALAVMGAIMLILALPGVIDWIGRLLSRLPHLSGARRQLDIVHQQSVGMLRRPSTWWGLTLSAGGALLEVTLLWVIVVAVGHDVGWTTTAFIYGIAYLAGAVTTPGGIGGFDATVVSLLTTHGLGVGAATAAALLLRAADKGVITVTGICAYVIVRRGRHRPGPLLGAEEDDEDPPVAAG